MSILQKIKKNRIQLLVLFLIVVVHCAYIAQKEGYHMDELLSFELSNAEYNPWIVPTQPQGRLAKFMQEEIDGENLAQTFSNVVEVIRDVAENGRNSKLLTYKADVYEEPVWIERQDFEAYVTTGQRDRFNLLSVYFNVKDDNHPPVHFMLLHLISSLFAGKVSVWMGCLINVLALLGSCICMMKGGELLEKHGILQNGAGKCWGILAAVLYGCSAGAVATTLLIRMYGVMTFLCVLTLYLHAKKMLEGTFDKKNKGLIAVTILGFLTQYYFLFYCIVLAVVTFVLLLVEKRKKEAGIYVRSMVIAAVLGVCIFPFSILDVFASGRGVEALNNLQGGFADFLQRLGIFGDMILERCFGFTLLGILLLAAGIVCIIWALCKRKGKVSSLFWMLLLPPVCFYLLAAKMSPMYVDRYVMAVFPFVMMLAALCLICVAEHRKRNSKLLCVAGAAVLSLLSVITYDGEYLYKGYENQLETAEEYRDLPCICLYEGSGYYDNLLEFCNYEKTLLIRPAELAERVDTSSIHELEEVVVLFKQTVDEGQCLTLLQEYGFEVKEVLVDNSVHKDKIYLLKKDS